MRCRSLLLVRRFRAGVLTRGATVLIVAMLGAVSCSSDDRATTPTTTAPTLVPDERAIAPGECDPAGALAAPTIVTGGRTTAATLGLGDFGCGGVNGEGYISFSYNPVLVEGAGSIQVSVGDGVAATFAWAGDTPFVEEDAGVWTSTLGDDRCIRLTITVSSVSGTSSAVYGADIRSGGDAVDCPQREIDPADPTDGDADATSPPPSSTIGEPPTSESPSDPTVAASTTEP